MNYKKITVNTKENYNVYINSDIKNFNFIDLEINKLISKNYSRVIIIIDSNLQIQYKSYFELLQEHINLKNNYNTEILYINISENLKTRQTKEQIENKLLELNLGRDGLIITISGGVLLDLMGFVAATYKRGIPIIYMPTTLLAMVDASVGGKTGVNTEYGKNQIGIIKQPHSVFVNTSFLYTLNKDDYFSALAEVIKLGIIYDRSLLDYIINNYDNTFVKNTDFLLELIYKAIKIKSYIIEQDEYEYGLRETLNFGHTIGHAIEKSCDYNIKHGYAVAIGMWVEAEISNLLNILSYDDLIKIKKILKLFFYNKINCIANHEFINLLQSDKKNKKNNIHCILVKSLGDFYTKDNKYSFAIDENILNKLPNIINNCDLLLNHD